MRFVVGLLLVWIAIARRPPLARWLHFCTQRNEAEKLAAVVLRAL
jgi:hypothetical protein